jgi:hypothetical protein
VKCQEVVEALLLVTEGNSVLRSFLPFMATKGASVSAMCDSRGWGVVQRSRLKTVFLLGMILLDM